MHGPHIPHWDTHPHLRGGGDREHWYRGPGGGGPARGPGCWLARGEAPRLTPAESWAQGAWWGAWGPYLAGRPGPGCLVGSLGFLPGGAAGPWPLVPLVLVGM